MTHTERIRGRQFWDRCLFGSQDNLQWKHFCSIRYGGKDPVIEQYFLPKVKWYGWVRKWIRDLYHLPMKWISKVKQLMISRCGSQETRPNRTRS